MTVQEFEAAVGASLDQFGADCHRASLSLVLSGALGSNCRVARGTCEGVGGQHSWVVLGWDCYDKNATVVDPTLWSYDETVEGIWTGKASERPHEPFGAGSIWQWGRPNDPTGEILALDPDFEFSSAALGFLDMLGPLDFEGWAVLAHAPVGGWPSEEIFKAMYRDKRFSVLIPIDIVGMATDENPRGLYLPRERS
jgi:hypothetical protein